MTLPTQPQIAHKEVLQTKSIHCICMVRCGILLFEGNDALSFFSQSDTDYYSKTHHKRITV
jgi:hypothetical protein